MTLHSNGAFIDRCACGYGLMGSESGRCPECGRNLSVDGSSPIATYRERRFGAHRDFTLYHDRVMVLSRKWSGTGTWLPVRLDSLSISTITAWVRTPMFKQGMRLFNGTITLTLLAVWLQAVNGFSLTISIGCVVLCLLGAGILIATYRPAEFVRFHLKEYREKIVLDIARAGPDSEKFDEFVAAVKSAIESNRYRDGDWVMMPKQPPK